MESKNVTPKNQNLPIHKVPKIYGKSFLFDVECPRFETSTVPDKTYTYLYLVRIERMKNRYLFDTK